MGRSAGSHGDVVQLVAAQPAQLVVVLDRRRLARRSTRASHTVIANDSPSGQRPPGSGPGTCSPSSTSTPSSSRSSRCSASSWVSPGSTLPPGNSQPPASAGRLGPSGREQEGRAGQVVDQRRADDLAQDILLSFGHVSHFC